MLISIMHPVLDSLDEIFPKKILATMVHPALDSQIKQNGQHLNV